MGPALRRLPAHWPTALAAGWVVAIAVVGTGAWLAGPEPGPSSVHESWVGAFDLVLARSPERAAHEHEVSAKELSLMEPLRTAHEQLKAAPELQHVKVSLSHADFNRLSDWFAGLRALLNAMEWGGAELVIDAQSYHAYLESAAA